MSQNTFTIRCPSDVMAAIEQQVKLTKQNKTAVVLEMLLNSIPSLHITERAKLPSQPGGYFVYTPDHKLLYVGKADNLQNRWNSHHKYQYFIENSMQSRIGYFVLDSVDNLSEIAEEFQSEPTETVTSKALVTNDRLEEVKEEIETLKERLDSIYSTLTQLGVNSIIKKLETYQPPRGIQNWEATREEISEGITRSALIKKLGFDSTKAFEDGAALLELDPTDYLEELSGWENRPVETGSARTRFFPPATS